eukprot:6197651-Lingulodinium_polyedra.AAC.1
MCHARTYASSRTLSRFRTRNTSSDPGPGPEQRLSSTPARLRASGAVSYPPTLATPTGKVAGTKCRSRFRQGR